MLVLLIREDAMGTEKMLVLHIREDTPGTEKMLVLLVREVALGTEKMPVLLIRVDDVGTEMTLVLLITGRCFRPPPRSPQNLCGSHCSAWVPLARAGSIHSSESTI